MNIFPKWFNRLLPIFNIIGTFFVVITVGVVWYWFSPKNIEVGYSPTQPINFSHKTHAGDLAIDCRYCHTTVEKAAFAAIPSTEICMNCHNLVRRASGATEDSPDIAKVVASFNSGKPIEWVKVHMLPDYTYFDHSRHITVGVSCVECHGRVDKMTKVFQAEPLSMSWCLDCHRDPAPRLRPQENITELSWKVNSPEEREQIGIDIMKTKGVVPREDCNTCHR